PSFVGKRGALLRLGTLPSSPGTQAWLTRSCTALGQRRASRVLRDPPPSSEARSGERRRGDEGIYSGAPAHRGSWCIQGSRGGNQGAADRGSHPRCRRTVLDSSGSVETEYFPPGRTGASPVGESSRT